MPLIDSVVPEKASGQVAEIYGDITKAFGRVPNAMQIYSSSPALLAQQWQATGYYFTHPNLTRPLLATIRMLVSQENDCGYCIGFNAGMLINMVGWTPEQVSATKHDVSAAPLSEQEKALLHFVLKAVNRRETTTRAEIDALTRLGWTHADLLDAVAHGARNVGVDIVFNTFQIENDF
jgi:alkylhydroperoxidase family enzyme